MKTLLYNFLTHTGEQEAHFCIPTSFYCTDRRSRICRATQSLDLAEATLRPLEASFFR